ncbi:putative major sperm protein (MSP) [Helianthus annuus]|nr:putative major sperm protein (MSP) [Helianthus annuus]
MSTGELITVDQLDLKFHFELNKQINSSLKLTNNTDDHVGYKVKTTNPKKYCVRPNTGVVLPRSTCEIIGALLVNNIIQLYYLKLVCVTLAIHMGRYTTYLIMAYRLKADNKTESLFVKKKIIVFFFGFIYFDHIILISSVCMHNYTAANNLKKSLNYLHVTSFLEVGVMVSGAQSLCFIHSTPCILVIPLMYMGICRVVTHVYGHIESGIRKGGGGGGVL